MCWNKPSNCDADLSSHDTGGNDGSTWTIVPPRSITVHDDSRIARIAGMDRAAPSRTIAQQIHSITHHSVFVVTFDAV
ncbi:hypothetical protein TNCV_1101211 [Trichonephila clavipes]|nr:hypothetical protein TNCV_1101211 [Trichonephila clavipes]